MPLNHPPKDQLMAFGQGTLAAVESCLVEQHLEVCKECCATLLNLKDDTFVGLVRAVKPRMADTSSDATAESAKDNSSARGSGDSYSPTANGFRSEAIRRDTSELPECPPELREHPRYRIIALVGRGGMGSVYRAEHRLMQRPAAIKVINPELVRHPTAVVRFRREVQAAAKLSHPNIVAAWDAEQAGDLHLLVMEFVDGTDLATIVQQQGPLDVEQACSYIAQAASGLQHAYEKGMVHRDIKPHNLMLTPDGRVRILDFGLAGIVSGDDENPVPDSAHETSSAATLRHLTHIGSVMGTPDYMAPEQAVDAHFADIRADIYSLGCTLTFLLTGRPPFEAEGVAATLKAHAQDEPESLPKLRKDVPPELSRVAAKMLAKNPNERFQTPAEVVAALQACEKLVRASARTRKVGWTRAAKIIGLVMAGCVLLAGVIVLSTNRGWLEIRSQVDDLKVTVRNNGERVEFSDLKTGSQVKWIRGGKCDLEIVGNRNDVRLDQHSVTLSRFGHVIVTATWNAAGLDLIRSFAPTDQTISRDGVTAEAGGWKITATSDRTAQLFEISDPPLQDGGVYFCVAKLKTENVVGKAYLDMASLIPRRMDTFMHSGIDRAISGTTDWKTIEVPMFLQPGEKPNFIRINVSIVGSGTVRIKDVELRGRAIGEPLTSLTEKSGTGSHAVSQDQAAVLAYLNDPRNSADGAVPVVLLGREGIVSIRFGNWLVAFEDILCEPTVGILGSFNIPRRDPRDEKNQGTVVFAAGKQLPAVFVKFKSGEEQHEVSINNHRFRLRSNGARLEFNDKSYDATNALQTILVGRDGSTELETPGKVDDEPETKKGVSRNLITDPSFENTALTQLPNGWRAWLNDGQEFRCEVVFGGHTGQRCLQISGKGTRGVVFGDDLKADRMKRYSLKGWVKFEGDRDARALIKFNYFRGSEFLGVHDLVGATAAQPGWHLFEKTDVLDAYPTADHFYAMCHVEGSGTGWFDDLELIAWDRDTLPTDFEARHGRHNRLYGPNSLHRWVGTWDTEYAFRETDSAPQETRLAMTTTSERTLGDYFLMSHARAKPPANEERLQFLLFDQNLGAFRQWDFSSNGKFVEWRGPWNGETQTLELRMLPDASNLYSREHFVDDDHIEAKLWFQYVMGQRDAGHWTATRKAFDGKVDIPILKAHVAEPAELSQLNKFAGEWTIRAKYKPSVWNPLPREETIHETSVWILGGRFLMTRAFNEKNELTEIWIATWEPGAGSNHFWLFNADGFSREWRMTWDEALNGFDFRAIDAPSGWSGTGFSRWVDDDSFDNQTVIKDENSRVLLDSIQERRRKK